MCPATMCPYLGLAEGSPISGDRQTECEESCGWFNGGACIAPRDLAAAWVEEYGPEEVREAPECEFSDSCQWQAQAEGLCPPRLAITLGAEPEDTRLKP